MTSAAVVPLAPRISPKKTIFPPEPAVVSVSILNGFSPMVKSAALFVEPKVTISPSVTIVVPLASVPLTT